MKVILTDDVVGLGDIGEVVNVKPGYARNFLIPRGLAVESETSSARASEHRMRQIDAKKKRLKGAAEERAKALQGFVLKLELRTGGHGKVFGSISAREIATKLAEHGYELDRRRVLLAEPIKKVGSFPVSIKLHPDVETEITIQIDARESTQDEEGRDVESARRAIEEGASRKQEAAAQQDADEDDDEASDE